MSERILIRDRIITKINKVKLKMGHFLLKEESNEKIECKDFWSYGNGCDGLPADCWAGHGV